MQGKIALEEHVAVEATLGDSQVFGAHVWDRLGPRLIDVRDMRLAEMDKHASGASTAATAGTTELREVQCIEQTLNPKSYSPEAEEMTTQRRELYRSSNGDCWYLCRGRGGQVVVSHQPNESSGGKPSQLEIGEFLTKGHEGPEYQALLQLIGELVDPAHSPNARQRHKNQG